MYDSGPETSLVTRVIATSGTVCRSLIVAADKASIVIVVSRGTSVELGVGPIVILMLSTAEAWLSGVEYAD